MATAKDYYEVRERVYVDADGKRVDRRAGVRLAAIPGQRISRLEAKRLGLLGDEQPEAKRGKTAANKQRKPAARNKGKGKGE